jgi:hypothetical protein
MASPRVSSWGLLTMGWFWSMVRPRFFVQNSWTDHPGFTFWTAWGSEEGGLVRKKKSVCIIWSNIEWLFNLKRCMKPASTYTKTLSQISRCGWRMDVVNHRMVLVHGPSRICGPKAVDGPPRVLDLDDLGWEEGGYRIL